MRLTLSLALTCALVAAANAQDVLDSRLPLAADALLALEDDGICVGEYLPPGEAELMVNGVRRVTGHELWPRSMTLLEDIARGAVDCSRVSEDGTCRVTRGPDRFGAYYFAETAEGARLTGVFEGLALDVEEPEQAVVWEDWRACASGSGAWGYAPVPFLARDLASDIWAGDTWRFRVNAPPAATVLRTLRVLSRDETGLVLETSETDEAGTRIGEPETRRLTWYALEAESHYPHAATRFDANVTYDVLGRLRQASRYIVDQPDGTTLDAIYAADFPGPPVHILVWPNQPPPSDPVLRIDLEGFEQGPEPDDEEEW